MCKDRFEISKFDLVIYHEWGDENDVERAIVLDVFEDGGEIRTDVSGVICNCQILSVVKGAGKQYVYDSDVYNERFDYQKHLFDEYGIEIKPSFLHLNYGGKP